jgi:ABC-type multidrug transport system fused ATPase/permease subunit
VRRPRGFEPPRLLRALAGVDESLLRQVWHERARHTALGGVVLGTALIAGFSMLMAINQSLGAFSALHLVPALIWAVFVLNLDRLLVTSMVGKARRIGSLAMRLAVALMFGFIIAEPLIMRIFETAIVQHVQDERGRQLDALRSNLVRCNGEERATAERDIVTPECQGFTFAFAETPASVRRELDGLRGEVTALEKTVKRDTDALARLRSDAVKECVGGGNERDGFTGRPGDGPLCRQRNADAEEFARIHPMAENAAKLATLRERVADLETKLGGAVATFEKNREAQINRRVEEERSHQGAIGFLERLDALHALTGQSFALFVGTWAIRLFFVAIDCLPVVVKFFGGTSGYDELFKIRAASSQRIFAERTETEERRILEEYVAERDEIERRSRMRRDEHDLSLQEHQVNLTARRGDAVSAYAAELLRGGRGAPPPMAGRGVNGVVKETEPV